MRFHHSITISLVTTLTGLSLLACTPATTDQAITGDQPPVESATSETKTMTETEAMAESKAMTDTVVVMDTVVMTQSSSLTETALMTETQAMTASPSTAGDAMLTRRGSLVGLGDGQHEGAGEVEIAGKAGAYTLKLTNFSSSAGPDLRVILSQNADPINQTVGADWLDLGKLQALSGDQAYALPADVDLSAYKSVVVYCVSFDFVFSAATLQ